MSTCIDGLDAAVAACGTDDDACRKAALEAFNTCKITPLTAAPGPGSFGAMFVKDADQPVLFGADTGGGSLVFRPVLKGYGMVAAKPRTCVDAAVAALSAASGAPERVYCFQQTTERGGAAGVYMAMCTSAEATFGADGNVLTEAVTCPILAALPESQQ